MQIQKLLILDTEVNHKGKIETLGLIDGQGNNLYKGECVNAILPYLQQGDFLLGHNIFKHDLQFLLQAKDMPVNLYQKPLIDTLWLSSLIFIKYPYHALVKDYKLDKTNDPIEDAKLCLELFQQCEAEFLTFPAKLQHLLYALLSNTPQFQHFFSYLIQKRAFQAQKIDIKTEVRSQFSSFVQASFFDEVFDRFLAESPVELAYVLRLLLIKMQFDRDISLLPAWIVQNLPKVHEILQTFLHYKIYDAKLELKRFFGYDDFRSFETAEGKKVSQQEVVESALRGEDLLAIFSTGGGKSLTFQLPALMIAEQLPYLTLVISPLQSLMKDQVDVLNHRHNITNVGYLNSSLDPLTRKEVSQKVEFGGIDLLYLSPEMLRSQSTIRLLSKRLIVRIVIDEAHCFSKWGHDFRIDYMFIADFVKALSKKNKSLTTVKISCFTATGKRDVTEEIKSYFREKLGNQLREFRSTSARSNLHYEVISSQNEEERFHQLIDLLENRVQSQPCIIFTRYTGAASDNEQGAKNLTAKINETLGMQRCSFYHGKMEADEKATIQNGFINGTIPAIVATNAFGMGVDKNDVRFVIHYGIPSSIENYLQEAGRAGRDTKDATCIILYNSEDINDNLQLNKSGEVKRKEVGSLLASIKNRFKNLKSSTQVLAKSAKELVKDAGWLGNVDFDEQYQKTKTQQETKLKTALFFLEKFGFLKREFNRTKVRATANKNLSLSQQFLRIDQVFSAFLSPQELEKIKEIYKLIKASQIIAIEDINVGLPFADTESGRGVKSLVDLLRAEQFIENDDEISLILNPEKQLTSLDKLKQIDAIGTELLALMQENAFQGSEVYFDKVQINSKISQTLQTGTVGHQLDLLLSHFKKTKKILIKGNMMHFLCDASALKQEYATLIYDAEQLLTFLLQSDYSQAQKSQKDLLFVKNLKQLTAEFSQYLQKPYSLVDLEKVLKFLHLFEIIGIEGGLFLYQTKFQLKNGENPSLRFSKEQYSDLEAFYQKKTEQAHIMDEFAKRLQQGRGVDAFVEDYFTMEYDDFLSKYFKNRREELRKPLSKEKYQKLYHSLSDEQQGVLKEKDNLLLIAGPGSGKTKSLVHKVASLILEDGIRKEEFLLLSFSRSAKFELKKRIIDLIGPQGYFLEINTFHGYALKLLQKEPTAEQFQDDEKSIIKQAILYLKQNPALQLPYSVLVLDEFQDINDEQFEFIQLIKEYSSKGEEMKAIAAGDDDQSIFGFAGGNIKHIQQFKNLFNAKEIILTSNYRSTQELVDFTSTFIQLNPKRIKQNSQLISKVSSMEDSLFQTEKTKIQAFDLPQSQISDFLSELLASPFFQKQLKSDASTAILFHNNETGLLIDSILKRCGYQTTLLLKEEGYKLPQTLEFAAFLQSCEDEQNPVTKDTIQEKLDKIIAQYGANSTTELLKKFVKLLQEQNAFITPHILRDAMQGLTESDLLESEKGKIILSTFHKAKGLEFDNVILCFDEFFPRSQKRNASNQKAELVRLLYVAMTRAKHSLFLLGNADSNPFFQWLMPYCMESRIITPQEKIKKEIRFLTSCRDINLGYNLYRSASFQDAFPLGTKVERSFNADGRVDFSVNGSVIQSSSTKFTPKLKKRLDKGYRIKEIRIYQRLAYFLKEQRKHALVYLFQLGLDAPTERI